MRSLACLAVLSLVLAGACRGRDAAPTPPETAAPAPPKNEKPPLEPIVTASMTVSYPVPDASGAMLINYSGVALGANRVLTVIVDDLPPAAKAPTIWFEDPARNGTSWNFETVPTQEVLLPELGLKVVVSEKPLPESVALATGAAPKLGAGVWVIGTYAESVDAAVLRGSVAKHGAPPNGQDTFLVESSFTSSSAGAGVYDKSNALVGIVLMPYAAKELGMRDARLGVVIRSEAIAKALTEMKIPFRTAP